MWIKRKTGEVTWVLGSTPTSNTWNPLTLAPRGRLEPPINLGCLFVEESSHVRNTQTPRGERRAGIKPANRLRGDGADHCAAVPPSKNKQTKGKKSNFSSASAGITHVPTPVPSATYEKSDVIWGKRAGEERKGVKRDDKWTSCVFKDGLPVWHQLGWWMSVVSTQKCLCASLCAGLAKAAVWTYGYVWLFQQVDLMSMSFRGSHDTEPVPRRAP